MNLPDLSGAARIGLDTETKDPGLEAGLGPGARRGGYIAGISVAVPEGDSWYLPIAHEGGGNLDKEQVLRWASEQLSRPNQPKVGANLLYDLDFLSVAGVEVAGPFLDVQVAEPLINEFRFSYSLETLATHYLGTGKDSDELYQYCADHYGGRATRKAQIGRVWKVPGGVAAAYAKSDALLPLRIMELQEKELAEQNLTELFDLETRLIPMLLAMRTRGTRVDPERAEQLSQDLDKRLVIAQQELWAIAGTEFNPNAPTEIGPLFDRLEIPYTLTPKSKQPSITKDYLKSIDHPIAVPMLEIRKIEHLKGTFIDGYVGKQAINGRIHCEFHQLKGDDNGTVSGRFSSSNPNLQNIPSRDEELAPLIRGLFIPEEGEMWACDDWSQIEYRLLAHHALGKGAEEARDKFRNDPKTDYHVMTQKMIFEKTGIELGRKPTKEINFGLVYGMGKAKLISNLGVGETKGKQLFTAYFEALPFVKETFDTATRVAIARGYVKTILNRRARFPFWEASDWKLSRKLGMKMDKDEMNLMVLDAIKDAKLQNKKPPRGGVKRAMGHKALNRVLQGGAADLMKLAMVRIWESGVCQVDGLGCPLLTVHDELDWSLDRNNPLAVEAHDEAIQIMKEGWDGLRIPLVVDSEYGTNWGNVA